MLSLYLFSLSPPLVLWLLLLIICDTKEREQFLLAEVTTPIKHFPVYAFSWLLALLCSSTFDFMAVEEQLKLPSSLAESSLSWLLGTLIFTRTMLFLSWSAFWGIHNQQISLGFLVLALLSSLWLHTFIFTAISAVYSMALALELLWQTRFFMSGIVIFSTVGARSCGRFGCPSIRPSPFAWCNNPNFNRNIHPPAALN